MKWFRILGLILTLAACQGVQAQTATVTWPATYQTINGWGGADANLAAAGCSHNTGNCVFNLTSAQTAMFFSPTSGIGLSLIRTSNTECPVTGACSVSASTVYDLTTLQEAVANGAQVDLTVAAPANLKYSGNFNTGAPGADGECIDTSEWSAYASYIVSRIQVLQANGVPVYSLDPYNEPDFTNGQCYWTGPGLDSFVGGTLGPALAAAGLSSVKLMLPTGGYWDGGFLGDYSATCLSDPACAQYVGIVAWHGYGFNGAPDGTGTGYCCSTAAALGSDADGKSVWMSEVNGGFSFNSTANLWNWDPSITDALLWARNINDYLTVANVSGWEYWELADCCSTESGAPFNDGLTQADLTTTSKRMYVIGQWSKFVRPGWVRMGATANPVNGVFVTAFRQTSSDSFAVVVVNNNSGNTSVTFNLSGFPTSPSSVTPWITSGSLNLAQQTSVSASDGSFTYTLPAYSVTSFVGNTTSATAPMPPTELQATVQ